MERCSVGNEADERRVCMYVDADECMAVFLCPRGNQVRRCVAMGLMKWIEMRWMRL